MGPLQGVLKLIPGLGNQLDGVNVDEQELKRVEAIVLSMTPHERARPARRSTAAAGSGSRAAPEPTVQQVNQLLAARKQMEKMMKQMGKGQDAGGVAGDRAAGARRGRADAQVEEQTQAEEVTEGSIGSSG